MLVVRFKLMKVYVCVLEISTDKQKEKTVFRFRLSSIYVRFFVIAIFFQIQITLKMGRHFLYFLLILQYMPRHSYYSDSFSTSRH